MANDGQIVFEVTADGKHAIADIKALTHAIQQETGKWDDAAKQSTDNISSSFSGMLKKLVAGFSAVKIGKALLDIGKDALQAASDLEEVQNVVDVTFGDGAKQIESWAKTAGQQFGLTETQAKRFTSTLGAMMKSAGMSGNEIVSMSTDLAGLAADMASFYNLDFDTAFQKIRSGISGETEPLKQLGINMSVANLNAYALQQGLSKTFEQMTQGEQTMLRYQYLMSATADAQGDFSRTSDGYANSLRQLESNIENLKSSLGKVLIPALTEATGFINGFITKLTGGVKETTVLDDFNAIEIDTQGKLAEIEKVASEARLLASELDAIGGSKADKAGSKVQQLANGLTSIDVNNDKLTIVRDFLSTLAGNVGALADLQGKDADGAKQWLKEIGEAADSLDPNDAVGWATLVSAIKEGLPGFEDTEQGAALLSSLSGGLSEIFALYGTNSAEAAKYMDALGLSSEEVALTQGEWLETCKRLTQTIPGLNSIINTETGEINGGTDAVNEYIKAWEEGQKKLAMLNALQEKENALSSRFSDLPGLQLDMALEKRRAKQRLEELKAIYEQYGAQLGFDKNGKVSRDFSNIFGLDEEGRKALNAAADALDEQIEKAQTATDKYNTQKEALEEAQQALEEYRETVEEMPGDIEQVTDATEDWLSTTGKTEDEIKNIVAAAQESLTALADYAEGVRDSITRTIESVAKGFNRVDYNQFGKIKEKVTEISMSMAGLEEGSDEWKNLEAQLAKYNEQLVTTDNIYANLESQKTFLEDYLANLAEAQRMGLSAELLASLSDGSVESAQYLSALVNDTTGKTAKEIDELYAEVQAKKKELAGALTDQQLTADQVYQNMAAAAKAAVEALDLEGEAQTNSGKTVAGIAQGIADHVDDVQAAVDSIIAQLERLSGWGISIDLGSFGNIPVRAPSDTVDRGRFQYIASNEQGLDVVPFDGYLSVLHAGESILTAEEARIWRHFKEGGMDYDAMGNVMRDNIKPGGNVYLNGRLVGEVISDQQGRSYRQLQRSGWQG